MIYRNLMTGVLAMVLVSFTALAGFAAYNHSGDTDSANFRSVYPDKVGTKLTVARCVTAEGRLLQER